MRISGIAPEDMEHPVVTRSTAVPSDEFDGKMTSINTPGNRFFAGREHVSNYWTRAGNSALGGARGQRDSDVAPAVDEHRDTGDQAKCPGGRTWQIHPDHDPGCK